MSNAASTPEFREILQELYDSRRYRDSGSVLKAAWTEYHRRYGRAGSVQKQRYAMRKTAEGMNPKNCWVLLHVDSGQTSKTYKSKTVAKKWLRRLSAKDGVGSWALYTCEQLAKEKGWRNPRKRKSSSRIRQSEYSIAAGRGFPYIGPDYEIIDGKHFGRFSKTADRKPPHILVGFIDGKAKVIEENPRKNPQGYIESGSGFWNVTKYPYGGDFGRAPRDKDLPAEFIERIDLKGHTHEVKVRLLEGTGHHKAGDFVVVNSRYFHEENPRKKKKPRRCPSCGGVMSGARCLTCLKNPKRKRSKRNPVLIYNPKGGVRLPASNIEIRYRRTGGEYRGEWFRHPFKSSVNIIGLRDGSLLIKSNSGQRLWGEV